MDFIQALVWLFRNWTSKHRSASNETLVFPEIPQDNNNGKPSNNGKLANLFKSNLTWTNWGEMIHISYKLIFVENHKDESAATAVTTNGRCFAVSVDTKCKETCHQHRMDESNFELEHGKQSDEFEQDIEMRLNCLRRN